MEYQEFPRCCGINIISQLGYSSYYNNDEKYPLEKVKEYILNLETYYYKSAKAFNMLTLNNDQYNVYGELMKELGYDLVKEGFNPGHNTMIFIFIKELHPEKSKEYIEKNKIE